MNKATSFEVITTCVGELINERDELKRENENLRAKNSSLVATIKALKQIEEKYNDIVVWFTRKVKDD
jgi:regulator of replication initiation timing